jgi:hypothetical protein
MDGYFYDGVSCKPCLHNCKECSSRTFCTSCFEYTELQDGECRCHNKKNHVNPITKECEPCQGDRVWDLTAQTCNLHCPEKTYKQGDHCADCSPICKKCDGPTALECTVCYENSTLYSGICICLEPWHMNPESYQCDLCPYGNKWHHQFQICMEDMR